MILQPVGLILEKFKGHRVPQEAKVKMESMAPTEQKALQGQEDLLGQEGPRAPKDHEVTRDIQAILVPLDLPTPAL